jgi:hypothetical protein
VKRGELGTVAGGVHASKPLPALILQDDVFARHRLGDSGPTSGDTQVDLENPAGFTGSVPTQQHHAENIGTANTSSSSSSIGARTEATGRRLGSR